MSFIKTRLKQALMWLVNRHLVPGPFVDWAMQKFDLKGF